jgi:thiol-disulfide isomerase/thioredoxin
MLAIVTGIVVVAIVIAAIIYMRRSATNAQLQNASQVPVAALLTVGVEAPEFSVSSTHGLFDLAKTKKPVFLEVYATWCPHCQRETVVVNNLYETFKNTIDFIAVSGSATGMDGIAPSSQADVIAFAQAFNVKYPIAYDPTLAVAHDYLQGGFPTIVIIDSKKRITYMNSGEVAQSVLAAQLARVR